MTDVKEEAEVSNATAIQVNELLTTGSVACNSLCNVDLLQDGRGRGGNVLW